MEKYKEGSNKEQSLVQMTKKKQGRAKKIKGKKDGRRGCQPRGHRTKKEGLVID